MFKNVYELNKNDINYQLIATELDVSAKSLYFYRGLDYPLFHDVKNNGEFITSFDNGVDLYNYKNIVLILVESINEQILVFKKENFKELKTFLQL